MCGKEFNCFSNADAMGGADVHQIASVMVRRTAYIVSFLPMDGPGAALVGGFVD